MEKAQWMTSMFLLKYQTPKTISGSKETHKTKQDKIRELNKQNSRQSQLETFHQFLTIKEYLDGVKFSTFFPSQKHQLGTPLHLRHWSQAPYKMLCSI